MPVASIRSGIEDDEQLALSRRVISTPASARKP